MPNLFNIQSAVDAVIGLGRLSEMSLSASEATAPVYDGEDWNVLVQSDLIDGDAVICGDVRDTKICAANIFVGGAVTDSELTASGEVRISSDLGGGRVIVGSYELARKNLESCRLLVEHTREQAESLARRVGQDGKRIDKACRALRIPLDFSVGRIVQQSEGKVSVDLTCLYDSIDAREVDLAVAVREFFAKGIVGVIARTNRKYLVNYPAREKVFMQLLKSLRELFGAVLERDEMLKRLSAAETELENLQASLSERGPSLAVGGRLAPQTEIEFILPWLKDTRDGGFNFAHKTAQLCVRPGPISSQCDMAVVEADGERSTTTTERDELEGLVVSVDDGKVRWSHVAATAVEMV